MSNMSYCRFQNTLIDLQDCYNNSEDYDMSMTDDLSPNELKAREQIIRLCLDIANDFGDEVGFIVNIDVDQ